MPVGQESPTRGMGVWAKTDTASSKMEQSRYLVMGFFLGTVWIIGEVEKFRFGAGKIREYPQWHSAKIAETGFCQFWHYQSGGYWDLRVSVSVHWCRLVA